MRYWLLGIDKFLGERDWNVLRMLVPFFLEYRGRIVFALGCLGVMQAAQLSVPFLLKWIVDALDSTNVQIVVLPIMLVVAYVGVRFVGVAVREARDAIYGTVMVRAMRRLSLRVLRHLHALDLEYHLSRKTGGISRDMDRGVNAIATLMRILSFQVLSMFIGVVGVTLILLGQYDATFAAIVLIAVVFYSVYTVRITEWRTPFIRQSNEANSRANTRAVDSLINYETVKYFGNEELEAKLYDEDLEIWESARKRNRYSLAGLNAGQAFFVHAGMLGMMLLAAKGVVDGRLTLGDLVAINALAVLVFVPLNQLGGIYRELKRCFTDVERMFDILETEPLIKNHPVARALPAVDGPIEFRHVTFGYQPERTILNDVSFSIGPGEKVAVVGASGGGKSTLTRLLFRFYDVDDGAILVNGADIREVDLMSLRSAFGFVPQDTTLFNASLYHNISYGNPAAGLEEVTKAASLAHLAELIERLPKGFETVVGERGLKLSGGEKQRVAIARAILRNPTFLIFDEATSSLDSRSEKAILAAIDEISAGHTTMVIAHRLSTVVDADKIVVLKDGRVQEVGSHRELLAQHGIYTDLWNLQLREQPSEQEVAAG
ncbi:MAG: ABC transporter ATP-binding protein/permease [Pseudomonadales bacterium]